MSRDQFVEQAEDARPSMRPSKDGVCERNLGAEHDMKQCARRK